jgi:hypothetical protein
MGASPDPQENLTPMAHPLLPTRRTAALAGLGLAAALALPAGPVTALTGAGEATDPVGEVCTELLVAEGLCELVGSTLDATAAAAAAAAAPVTDAAAPVVDAVAPVVEAVGEILPPAAGEVLPPAVGDVVPVGTPQGSGGSGAVGSTGGSPVTGSEQAEPTKVEAAGKGAEEVAEPQAPPAEDGRIAGGPTIQPLDASAIGANIAGVRSQNGVNLQPYDAPLVSIPMDAPQVAGAPITTASPIAAVAADAIAFAGSAVLPHTTGAAAWVTASGLGLLAGTGVLWRRRFATLDASTLDQ